MHRDRTERLIRAGITVAAWAMLLPAAAWADAEQDQQGALIAALVAIVAVVPVQFVVACLFPEFTRKTRAIIAQDFWPCAGWGALVATLATTIAAIFGQAGGAAQALGIAVAIAAALLAVAGGVGTALIIGEWVFRRWETSAPGPLPVLPGAALWCAGALVPVVGWIAGLLTLFVGLGASALVLLNPSSSSSAARRRVPPQPPSARPLGKLSVIIPAYNEQGTVHAVIDRVTALSVPLEVIVVDDGSTDGTAGILQGDQEAGLVRLYTSPTNLGKGAAIRIGLSFVTGDIVIIQDADLELDPEEYPRLLAPIIAGRTNVVFGSRFLHPSPGIPWRTRMANRILARWCNLLYRSRLTDVSTAYKVFRVETVRGLNLRSVGFEFCAEVTGKLLRRRETIEEVAIGYHPRGRADGKKLNYVTDGLRAAWTLLALRFAPVPEPESPAP